MPEQVAFIRVEVRERDALYFATSPELPGLFVIGKDRNAVIQDVGPMIEKLYELNHQISVKADLAAAPSFDHPAANDGQMQYYAAKVPQRVAA